MVKYLGTSASATDLTPKSYVEITQAFTYTGTLAVTTGVARWYNDSGRTLTFLAARASLGTAPVGASVIIDITKSGTTIFTNQANRPTIAVSTNTAKVTTFDVTTIADGEYLTIDIDQIGSSTAGSDLVVSLVLG